MKMKKFNIFILVAITVLASMVSSESLILIIVGWGIFITLPIVFFMVMNIKVISAMKKNKKLTPNIYKLYLLSIALAALGCGFASWIGAQLGGIDTGGGVNHNQFMAGIVVDAIITVTLISIIWRWQTKNI